MGSNRKLIFGAALVVAGLVFWGLMTALNGVNRVAKTPPPAPRSGAQQATLPTSGRMIAYAASDIPQGMLVTKNMIEMRPAPGNGPTTPFITDPQTQALGYITNTRIPKGALIRPSDDFVGHISEVGVSGMLRPGTRAIVIPFANKPTLHDLVAIGDHVDINAAFDGQEARTIVPNVRVLAVDVFGADFPQVNIARRGSYKADVKGSAAPAAGEAPASPGTAATPTPTPAQGGGRPDPAVTLEVSPEQANRILLTQASGGVLDFVVLPSGGDVTLVGDNSLGLPAVDAAGNPIGKIGGLTTISAVTKPQLAPYAERKKQSGGSATPASRVANDRERSASKNNLLETSARPSRQRFPMPDLPTVTPLNPGDATTVNNGSGLGSISGSGAGNGAAESPTYNIPIYADGRTVRVETVPRPQD